jgi:hypothetical protein
MMASPGVHFPMLLSGLALLLSFLPLLAIAFRLLGTPVLILSQRGVTTPLLGTLDWHEIDGLYLRENASRGSVHSYSLQLRIPRLREVSPQFFFISKWSARLRRKALSFDILLRSTNEAPEVILEIAQHLWTLNTGKDHSWSPFMSEEYHVAQLALNALSKDAADANVLMARLKADPEGELQRLEEFKRQWAFVTGAQRRALRRMTWLNAAIIVTVAVILIAKIASVWR